MVHAVYIPICFTMCVYRIAFLKSIELSTRAGFYCFIGKFCCLEKGQLCAVSVVENSITLQYMQSTNFQCKKYKKFLPLIQIYSICNIVLKFHKLLLQYSYKTYKTKECSLEDELTEGKIKLLLRKKKKQEKESIGF